MKFRTVSEYDELNERIQLPRVIFIARRVEKIQLVVTHKNTDYPQGYCAYPFGLARILNNKYLVDLNVIVKMKWYNLLFDKSTIDPKQIVILIINFKVLIFALHRECGS